MKKQLSIFFILITIIGMVFLSCDNMATLFHGEKPPDIYTVTFDANGASGTVPAPQTAESGTVITLPEKGDLAKAGSIFTGWSETPNGNGAILSAGASVIVTKNIIFYAQWLAQYNVTFNANGANGTPPAERIVNDGTVIILPDGSGLSKGTDIFAGWNESAGGGGTTYSVGASVTVTRNMAFHAQWLDGSTPQYTVTFNANGATDGAAPAPQTVYRGISITVPGQGTLAYSGKTFGGWNTQTNGGGTNYETNAVYTVTGNVTLYAKWQSVVQYTVTYHANGASGAVPTAQAVDPGTEITLPGAGDMASAGKKFAGWSINTGGTGTLYPAGAAYTVNGNITFYAQWQDLCTVTYHANGASGTVPATQTVDPGTEITLPGAGDMASAGKKFAGWSINAGGTGTLYPAGAAYTVTGNITLYAQWQSPYTVTFNANGATSGTAPAAQTVDPWAEITLPGAGTMAYSGKKFTGWNTQASGGGTSYAEGTAYTVNRNVILYAQWQDLYTVTFSANGASGAAPDAQTVDPGTVITLPGEGTMIYAGKMFDGWNTQANGGGTSYAEGASYTVNATISLYAKWVNLPIEPPGATLADKLTWLETNAASNNTYIITLNYDEGIGPKTLSYSGKSNVTLRMKNTVMRTVSLSSYGTLFTVRSGVTLILDSNITLQGRNNSNNNDYIYGLVSVDSNGTLIMNAGTKITGNTNSSPNSYSAVGGGVYVSGGTFTMNGGEISGNTVSANYSAYGGGVYVTSSGTFTMNDGKISGNTVSASSSSSNYKYGGGGVYVSGGTFTMNGGEISGNTASTSSTSSTLYVFGGGVYVNQGRFTKNGGTIYGSNGDVTSNTVENKSGTLLDNRGHAVYVGSSSPAKKMENTVEPGVYLFFNYNNGNPVWSGGWE